jgi:5-methylcytosine-specific restriction protein A
MPEAINRPCAWPGCRALTTYATYCYTHSTKARADRERRFGTADERGYDARWRRYRVAYLAAHPLCVLCERAGRVTAAEEIDHIIPRSVKPYLFWEPTNHQGLCRVCHRAKTAQEARSRPNILGDAPA